MTRLVVRRLISAEVRRTVARTYRPVLLGRTGVVCPICKGEFRRP